MKIVLMFFLIYIIAINAQDVNCSTDSLPNPDQIVKVVKNSKGQCFACDNKAVTYRSDDGGKIWVQKTNGLPTDFMLIDIIVLESDNIAIGCLDKIKDEGFIYKTIDSGEKWTKVNKFELWFGREFLKGVKGRVFVINSDIYYTDDEFKTMKKVQFDKKKKAKLPQNILINPNGYLIAFELDSSLIVLKSVDNGINWRPINSTKLFNWFDAKAVARAKMSSNGEIVIIKNKDLFVSADDGKTWENKGNLNSALP